MNSLIQIRVMGCVKRGGGYKIGPMVSVRKAIKKAGGFRTLPYPPSGVITIRSKRVRDGVYYPRRRFNFKKNPDLMSLSLRSGDLVIVQYDIKLT